MVSTFVPATMRLPRRASTLPGPTSTNRRAPASCRASNVSRQRTGWVSAPASSARTSSNGCALAHEITGSGALRSRPRRAPRGTARPRAPSTASERAGDRQRDRAQAALAGEVLDVLQIVAVAGQHDLAGSVVVGHDDAGGPGDRLGVLGRGADERDHRAARVGLGHQAAAQDDQLERVVEREHAGGGERGQLAQRVPGRGRRLVAQRGPARPARAEDRGLLEAGGFLDAQERVLAHEVEAALVQLGATAPHGVAHLRGL
jgi:hypothetical protein